MRVRTRVLLFLCLVVLVGTNETGPAGKTLAYFTSAATSDNAISTVTLSMTAPSVSGVFNIGSNMIPGDFQLRSIDILNGGTAGVVQQDFTYTVVNTSAGPGNLCSRLDSVVGCASANPPGASATGGAAFLLVRCTNAAGTTPLPCGTSDVWVTQVYPTAGAGTQAHITSGGLVDGAIGGVATGGFYSITVGGTQFTGGQVLIDSAFEMGGPYLVAGNSGQTTGVAASKHDYLASIVYLPTQAGDTLADQTSTLTFTWTAEQRIGTAR